MTTVHFFKAVNGIDVSVIEKTRGNESKIIERRKGLGRRRGAPRRPVRAQAKAQTS